MSDYAELVGRFHHQLVKVPSPDNARVPGGRVMTGSREEAKTLLRSRFILWEMDDLHALIPQDNWPHRKLWERWREYSDFWEEKSIEDANTVDAG